MSAAYLERAAVKQLLIKTHIGCSRSSGLQCLSLTRTKIYRAEANVLLNRLIKQLLLGKLKDQTDPFA
ncbi:hypothetical protein D3C78_1823130 [compost metagenome]